MSDERRTRRYETMIVLRTDLQEAGIKEQAERVRKLLETQGAVVAGVHEWGLRELAYIIQKERRGYYLLAEYTGAQRRSPSSSARSSFPTWCSASSRSDRTRIHRRWCHLRAMSRRRPVPALVPTLQADDDELASADAEVIDVD